MLMPRNNAHNTEKAIQTDYFYIHTIMCVSLFYLIFFTLFIKALYKGTFTYLF